MKIKNKIKMMISIFLSSIYKQDSDYEKYKKLKINNVPSIKKSDLPSEFSNKSFKIVDEFIKKTIKLNNEVVIFFDYKSGKILKCRIGGKNNVKLEYESEEFTSDHIASIHNHTKNMYTPPSYKNFGIFLRDFEKYELIAGWNGLWILEGKLTNAKLSYELNIISKSLFDLAWSYSKNKFENINEIEDNCDEEYGKLLSNYINNKNINGIQLTKLRYKHD